jgi:hypothetical protein
MKKFILSWRVLAIKAAKISAKNFLFKSFGKGHVTALKVAKITQS